MRVLKNFLDSELYFFSELELYLLELASPTKLSFLDFIDFFIFPRELDSDTNRTSFQRQEIKEEIVWQELLVLLSLFENSCSLRLYCESWKIGEWILTVNFTRLKELITSIDLPIRFEHFSFLSLWNLTSNFSAKRWWVLEFNINFDRRNSVWSVNLTVNWSLFN